MAIKVEVHFKENDRKFRVQLDETTAVDGVILIPDGPERNQFFLDHGFTRVPVPPEAPRGLKVVGPNGEDQTVQLQNPTFGPGVCYTVGVQVFCW